MSGGLIIGGDTSGSVALVPAAIAGSTSITIAAQSGTLNVGGPAFNAYANTTTSISAGTRVKVTFATEAFDTNSNFASSRFTPTVAGYYQIGLTLQETNGTSTILQAEIYKNGAACATGGYTGTAGSYYIASATTLVYMNGTTDYLEGYCYSSATTAVGNGSNANVFYGFLARTA